MEQSTQGGVLKKAVVWQELYFYRKSDTIYRLTVEFCRRFLPAHGDRTVDQMVQAARSGKQNIVEGSEDGQTSSEMEIKLLNVARGSLQELRSDYQDYLNTHRLRQWESGSSRQRRLRDFCHSHNDFDAYAPLLARMTDEEMANLLLTLCHQTDKMMCSYIRHLEERFIKEGGIKERMYAARTGYRQQQDAEHRALQAENQRLKEEVQLLRSRIQELERELEENLGEPRRT